MNHRSIATERRRLLAWVLAPCAAVFALMSLPLFLGRVFTADDLGAFHLPIRQFYSQQLRAGQPWDWMPSLFCGFYLTGEGQLGGYHPLHLLLYRTLSLDTAFDLELLLNYPFLAVGTYLFLRRIVVRREAAVFGAAVFTFSSFNLLHFVHPNAIAIIAHLPWLLWLIELAIVGQGRQRVYATCGIALLTGSQLLLGYPQYVWLSLLCEAAYAAVRIWKRTDWQCRTLELVSALFLGALVGSVQLLPTIDALRDSTRTGVDDQFRASGSLHPLNLVQPFAPYLFKTRVAGQNTHELGMYFGCVPLVLCCWLWLNRARWGRAARIIWPTVTLGTLALLYSLGEYGPVYRIQGWLPLVNSFRFPCRAIALVELSVAVLAGVAFAQLIQRGRASALNDPRRLAAPAGPGTSRFPSVLWLPTVFSFIATICFAAQFREHCSTPQLLVVGPVLLFLATSLIIHASNGARWASYALSVLAVADLTAYGLSYAVLPKTEPLDTFIASTAGPGEPAGGRLLTDDGGTYQFGNRLILAGYSLADGYAGLEPVQSIRREYPESLRAANIRWQRTGKGWQFVEGREARVKLLHSNGDARLTHDSPGVIDVFVNASSSDMLLVSESFHRGWQASIDGQPVAILRDETGLLSIPLSPGTAKVELRFKPASLHYGFLMTTFGLGLTMSWAVLAVRPHRNFKKELLHASPDGPGAGQRSATGLQRSESAR